MVETLPPMAAAVVVALLSSSSSFSFPAASQLVSAAKLSHRRFRHHHHRRHVFCAQQQQRSYYNDQNHHAVVVDDPSYYYLQPTAVSILRIRGGGGKGARTMPFSSSSSSSSSSPPKSSSSSSLQLLLSETTRRRLTVAVVAFALFNDMLQLSMMIPILPDLLSAPPPMGVANGKQQIAAGIFFAAKDICQLVTAPLAGYWTTRTSSSTALAVSTAALGVATLCMGQARTFRTLLLSRGFQGACSAAIMSGGLSLIAETHQTGNARQHRGAAIGAAYTGLALGVLSGPLVGGLLFEAMGRQQSFRLAGTVVLASALAQVLLMTFAPPSRGGGGVVAAEGTANTNKKKQQEGLVAAFRTLLQNSSVRTVVITSIAIHAVLGVLKPISMLVMDREFHLGTVKRSLVITCATVTNLLCTPVAGFCSDKVSKPHMLVIALLLMALSTALMALRGWGLWALYVCCSLVGAGKAMEASAGQALLADLVDMYQLGKYGTAFALSDMADSLGFIIGPIVGLGISQVAGPSLGSGAIGAFCLVMVPLVLRIPRCNNSNKKGNARKSNNNNNK